MHSRINKILIADDNELNAQIMREILRLEGYEAETALNGEIVVDMFENSEIGEYSAILMDIRMAKLDGWAATERIRSLDRSDAKTVKIYACTGSDFQEDRRKAKEVGMDGFLGKPVDVDELLNMLIKDFGT